MGLRIRLTLIVTLVLGVSLAASLVTLDQIERRAESAAAAERAGALLLTVSAPVALLLTQGRVPDLDNLVDELRRRRDSLDLASLMLVDPAGVVIAHTDVDRFGTPMADIDPFVAQAIEQGVPQVERVKNVVTRVAVPVQTGIRWGTLIGELDRTLVDARVDKRRSRLVLTVLAVSAVGLVMLLVLLSVLVVTPIQEVSEMAHRFAEGDLTARAPEHGGDEIAKLARGINTAAERLSSYTHELELEVRKRTEALEAANAELVRANVRLETLATTDGLTRLFNHRTFHQLLEREVTRQQRDKRPFSLVMADVDHFKFYNDSHGHPAGDEVLRGISRIFKENTREVDVVARYGGEEFVILFVGATRDDAMQRAEFLRTLVADYPFVAAEQQPLGRVSISMGVAAWPDDGLMPRQLVEAADKALYLSKDRGRNQVTSARDLPDHERFT